MRRTTTAALVAAALSGLTLAPASAGTPVVGGAKKASLSFMVAATGPQQHFLAETAGNDIPMTPDPEVDGTCAAPRCYAFPFTVAPTVKGSKTAEVSARITWSSPANRYWLSIVDVTKEPYTVTECFSYYVSGGQAATVRETLPVSKKYAVWVTVEQVVGATDTVTGVVHAPATDTASGSTLSKADPTGLFANPCQS